MGLWFYGGRRRFGRVTAGVCGHREEHQGDDERHVVMEQEGRDPGNGKQGDACGAVACHRRCEPCSQCCGEAIRLLNSMLLPKAGVFAEAQAQVVAATIAADIQGQPRPALFDGHGSCYVEVGDGMAAFGSGDFYAYPGPRVKLEPPTTESRRAKGEYEQLLDAWFE